MKNELIVEWKHVGSDVENTCERCGETGRAVMAELGIDIACQRSKDLGEFDGQEMDILVTVWIDTAFGVI